MLDCTKAAFRQTVHDLHKLTYIIDFCTQILYIGYLFYAIFFGATPIINAVLEAVCIGYFVFFLIVTKCGKDIEGKSFVTAKKHGAFLFKWTKRLIRLFTLGIAVWGLFKASASPTPTSVIMTAFMIVSWVFNVLLDIVFHVVKTRFTFIMEGLEADIDDLLRPAKNVGNFFKKMTGQEVEPPKELSETQIRLKAQAVAYNEEKKTEKKNRLQARKAERKAEKKNRLQEKKAEKIKKREERAELKRSTKAEKALLKTAQKKAKKEKRAKKGE